MPTVAMPLTAALKELVARYPSLIALTEPKRVRRTAEFLARTSQPSGKLLDIGCWPGALTSCLARAGWQVSAVDADPSRPIQFAASSLLDRSGIAVHEDQSISLQAFLE